MKLLSYASLPGPRVGYVAENGQVYDLARSAARLGVELPSDMGQLLALKDGMALARRVVSENNEQNLVGMAVDEVPWAPPVPKPHKILAVAGNFKAHVKEGGGAVVDRDNSTPRFFIKPVTTANAHQGKIHLPQRSNFIDYELELGVIVGKRCRDLDIASALDAVAGYTVFNDVSARKLDIHESRMPRPKDPFFDWLNGKWFDGFAPMGPFLITPDEVGDPQSLAMRLWVNRELRQDADTGQMVFGVAELLVWISQFVTLEPGDVIATGTPAGVGRTIGQYLQPGDVIEAEIERVGRLINVVADGAYC